MRQLRVLVVDDSAYNRRTIADLLSSMPGVEVVSKASDGDEALRLVSELSPDLITLDLEMPRMDGFTFLRLLMARQPTPVIVISGYAAKENVFRALELGAIDFVAKPSRTLSANLNKIHKELAHKVDLIQHLSPAALDPLRRGLSRPGDTARFHIERPEAPSRDAEVAKPLRDVVVVGASTGGPTALLELFGRLPSVSSASIVVAQHMPERFTRTFAERLDKVGAFAVAEAEDRHVLQSSQAWICPGGRCVEIAKRGQDLVVQVCAPEPSDRYVPSVDRLFVSAAQACGNQVTAVVLTGMGDDGAAGVRVVKDGGGTVLVESPETAVIFGMPGAAMRTGVVDRALPLPTLADHLGQRVK